MKLEQRPLLAITMGDPAGVGPEVVVSALARRRARQVCRPLVIGDARILDRAARLLGRPFTSKLIASASEADQNPQRICVLDLANADPDAVLIGRVSAAAGRAAADYIEKAVEWAQAGTVAGIVTGPINKEALRLAGVPYPGHTEMLAALCEVREVAMMLVHGEMRVSHVTTHVALREACELVTQSRVLSVIRLTDRALRRMSLDRPRIAVGGLNPHAGESGLFGEEEIREIEPAVAQARREASRWLGRCRRTQCSRDRGPGSSTRSSP